MGDETAMDLTDFPYMPLYIARLQRSKAWLMCKRDPSLAFYMMNLWMRSWHEVPAGSIEDDDDILADAAMADPKTWDKIKDKVLRGWERRDGRLFHIVVTEVAGTSYEIKEKQRLRTSAATEARMRKRDEERDAKQKSERASNVTFTKGIEEKGIEEKGREELGSLRSPSDDGKPSPTPTQIANDGVRIWNETCGDKLTRVQKITAPRKDAFVRIFREEFGGNWEPWREFCKRVVASPFLTNAEGTNRAGWSADFDFVLQPRNFVRIMEGKWDQSSRPPPNRVADSLAGIFGIEPPPADGGALTLDLSPDEWRTP